MIDINLLTDKYDPKGYAVDYLQGTPVPWLTFDDFLPDDVLKNVQQDIQRMPTHIWSKFVRNGSFMLECNNLKYAPHVRELVLNLNSSEFIRWLETVTGIKKLIPDPLLIGAGLMRCGNGDCLKLHTDFNWNDQLHLNRALSLIVYISKKWNPSWGGNLEFWSLDREKCLHKIAPTPNRMLLWNYDENLVHGHPAPIACPDNEFRDGLRLFYFTSNATPNSPPHRSLYWFNENGAYDKKENK